ncbi:NYN domain-containing protein [Nocardioides glacieisoli]|uniref:NYN domain-containing protein n=1 Tax=Nocardioides glacieisoli TaxID=1168730 RepID=A0A4Q2RU75_9ACTN|nr:NYN domain-containing protein [Nocardioides glacieisoli]RYB91405.1 NYN domain-containing protein [Nocardioides glacieisoli]
MGDRVAVYIDFDNVVISRYDALHGKGAWHAGGARSHTMDDDRLARAKVDLGAISDFATSFGVVAMTRAYADWSVPANAAYRRDLVDRAVDLVQLFAASGTKNGADIRLAVDAVEDLSRHPDITHVVLVAGDSDYVPLAQRCKRLGRTFVGIGVAGSTSSALVSACDEFAQYEQLPGVTAQGPLTASPSPNGAYGPATIATKQAAATKAPSKKAMAPVESPEQAAATALLARTMAVAKKDADGWVYAAALKSQMKRIDPAFDEKGLGFTTFKNFAESRSEVVETSVRDTHQLLRLR